MPDDASLSLGVDGASGPVTCFDRLVAERSGDSATGACHVGDELFNLCGAHVARLALVDRHGTSAFVQTTGTTATTPLCGPAAVSWRRG